MNLMKLLDGKDVLVGVIDVASDEVETPEQVADVIGEAMKYVAEGEDRPVHQLRHGADAARDRERQAAGARRGRRAGAQEVRVQSVNRHESARPPLALLRRRARAAARADPPLRRERDQAARAEMGGAGLRAARGAAPHGRARLPRHPLSGRVRRLRDGHARLGRARRGARPLHLRRRRHHGAGAHRHGLGAHGEWRLAGAEGALDAGHRRRPRRSRRWP